MTRTGLWRPVGPPLVPTLLTTALVVAGLAGCGEEEPVEGTGSVAVAEGRDAVVRSQDGRIAVRLPGDAVEGEGRLTVEPARAADGRDGWAVELSGAELTGRARIAFPEVELIDGEPPPLVSWATGPDGELRPAEDVEVTDDGVVVSTDHFSWWVVDPWHDALEDARAGLDPVYATAARGREPRCDQEQEVTDSGFTATSDPGDRVRWCLGLGDDDAPALRVVNTRGYTVAVETGPGTRPAPRGRRDLVAAVDRLVGSRPVEEGGAVTLLQPGEALTVGTSTTEPSTVTVAPSAAGYLATGLQHAVDALRVALEHAGSPRRPAAIVRSMQVEWCLADAVPARDARVKGAAGAARRLEDALGAALECARDAIPRLRLGRLARPVAEGFGWISADLRAVARERGAAAGPALRPWTHEVRVTPPAPEEPEAPAALVFTPGGYGPLRVGMSSEEAIATGLVERRTEPGCTSTAWMRPEHADVQLAVDEARDRVVVLGSYSAADRTDRGVGVGSTLDELRAAYDGELAGPETNEYGQQVFTVAGGQGFLTFFAAGDAGPDGQVTGLLASTGEPITVYEGEGPC